MGCPAELLVPIGTDSADASALAQIELQRLDLRYSHYRGDSLLAHLAADAGTGRWVDLTPEDERLFALTDTLHEVSAGVFDPTIGPLSRLWDFRNARVPAADVLDEARRCIGWQRFEREPGRARLQRTGMCLDLGGLVKEYAADRVAAILRERGIRHGLVDLGGDLAVIGPRPDGSAWRIGIRNPCAAAAAVANIALRSGGLATSGTDARSFLHQGRRYSHLIDPRSAEPIQSFDSISVRAESCLAAGAVATVALLLGTESGRRWLQDSGLEFISIQAASLVDSPAASAVDHLSAAAID